MNAGAKRSMKVGIFFCILALCITEAHSAVAETQISIACQSVNNFPTDFGTVWHTAVAKHNANPDKVTAASYMSSYLDIQKVLFKITDPIALLIYRVYDKYWTVLEEDYIANNGKIGSKSLSPKILAPLMKACGASK